MKLSKSDYEKYLNGFFITDCVIRKKDMFYFVAEQEFEGDESTQNKAKRKTRVVTCFAEPNPADVWSISVLTGMQRMKAGVSHHPKEQFVGVSLNDHVYLLGSGDGGFEDDMQGGKNAAGQMVGMRGGVAKTRVIDGWLWLAGSGRTVGRRLGRNAWEWHDSIPYKNLMSDGGFLDIDGFSLTDIYAAGGHGDLWHFDGQKWLQLPFPSNMTLTTVCCGGDGEVYIGADGGTVYQGRGDRWKRIHVGGMTLPYRDMVWHQNKVWCTNDHGIVVIDQGQHKKTEMPDWVRVCAGHMSAGDGVLLVAGMYGAAMHDGKDWHKIIDYNDLA
jgi:hypothetical protein